jgi:hypothetical protein
MSYAAPFACNLSALSAEQRLQHSQLAALLRAALVAVRELPDGYEFEFVFDAQTYQALAQITPLEHACCPFFSIALRLEPGGELLWQLTGREGVKQFLRAEFAGWFKQQG